MTYIKVPLFAPTDVRVGMYGHVCIQHTLYCTCSKNQESELWTILLF